MASTTQQHDQEPAALSKLDEYRGSNHWEGLHPSIEEPRTWDEGFRSFLLKYGMVNHMVYDVFQKGKHGVKDATGLRARSRFGENLEDFNALGLEFSYVNMAGEQKQEYDFSNEYEVLANLVCSPSAFAVKEDNWFGFIAISRADHGGKEMVVVFRGTETVKEWARNAKVKMVPLEGAKQLSTLELGWARWNLMCHEGFQQLYIGKPKHFESPRTVIHEQIKKWVEKGRVDKVTVVGHSLGAAMCQLCAIDLAYSKVGGDIPILALAWGAPKVGNKTLATWVTEQPNLRILRISVAVDTVIRLPPDWVGFFLSGGYKATGTELILSNMQMQKQGLLQLDVGNSPHHCLEQYLHVIEPSRDVALLNKTCNVLPEEYCLEHNIAPAWHSQTWPRTVPGNKEPTDATRAVVPS
ncbi:unnamed protein product [Ectocarpus sp. 8 AP-2014]